MTETQVLIAANLPTFLVALGGVIHDAHARNRDRRRWAIEDAQRREKWLAADERRVERWMRQELHGPGY